MQARVFLVGCSRSGTTVVQRCLAAHPAVTSFPETDFFGKAIGGWHGRLRARRGRIRPDRRALAFRRLAETLECPELADLGHAQADFRQSADHFVAALDRIAADRGARIWLEKTPKHFRYIRLLEAAVPAARFIHVVRDGRDVVGSLVDRARRYPGFGKQLDPSAAARLWNEAVRSAWRNSRRAGHVVLAYEDFVHAPEAELRRLCAALEIEYQGTMFDPAGASGIVTAEEMWKSGVGEPIAPQPSKFDQLFSAREQDRLIRRLDWRTYRRLFPAGVGARRNG